VIIQFDECVCFLYSSFAKCGADLFVEREDEALKMGMKRVGTWDHIHGEEENTVTKQMLEDLWGYIGNLNATELRYHLLSVSTIHGCPTNVHNLSHRLIEDGIDEEVALDPTPAEIDVRPVGEDGYLESQEFRDIDDTPLFASDVKKNSPQKKARRLHALIESEAKSVLGTNITRITALLKQSVANGDIRSLSEMGKTQSLLEEDETHSSSLFVALVSIAHSENTVVHDENDFPEHRLVKLRSSDDGHDVKVVIEKKAVHK
jgi:hypothetical protein